MADPKAPEPEYVNWGTAEDPFWMYLPRLREKLSAHGLAIVSEADKRVLEACAALPEKQLQASLLGRPFRASHQQREFAQAELARRSGT